MHRNTSRERDPFLLWCGLALAGLLVLLLWLLPCRAGEAADGCLRIDTSKIPHEAMPCPEEPQGNCLCATKPYVPCAEWLEVPHYRVIAKEVIALQLAKQDVLISVGSPVPDRLHYQSATDAAQAYAALTQQHRAWVQCQGGR